MSEFYTLPVMSVGVHLQADYDIMGNVKSAECFMLHASRGHFIQ
jgi:hypothetical protein